MAYIIYDSKFATLLHVILPINYGKITDCKATIVYYADEHMPHCDTT